MYIPFKQIPETAKIWIFQSFDTLTDTQIEKISLETKCFLEEWQSHGQPLTASFIIRYHRFLIILVDETKFGASGCSVDTVFEFVRKTEKKVDISFMSNDNVAFKIDDEIVLVPYHQLKSWIPQKINTETILFDNTITTFSAYQRKWQIPVKDSWVARYF